VSLVLLLLLPPLQPPPPPPLQSAGVGKQGQTKENNDGRPTTTIQFGPTFAPNVCSELAIIVGSCN